jgi:hypothetical protein
MAGIPAAPIARGLRRARGYAALIVGRAVEIHPVALPVAVTTGGVLAGIVGALLAGPALVAANAAFFGAAAD